MDARGFLELILPDEGHLIGLAKLGERRIQRVCPPKAQGGIELLLQFLEEFNAAGWDVYHAPASFIHPRGTWNEETRKFEHPRGQANVLGSRVLRTDADAKESHPLAHYDTRYAAASAAIAFSFHARLPLPLLVDSGGGVHPYWLVLQTLDPVLWKRLSDGLKRACRRFKFEADHRCTADSARVLRAPDFIHIRLNRIARVIELPGVQRNDVSMFMHLLEGEDERQYERFDRKTNGASGRNALPLGSVARAIRDTARDIGSDPNTVLQRCRQVREFATAPGAYRYDYHRLVAGAFKNCGAKPDQFRDRYINLIDPKFRGIAAEKFDGWEAGPPLCRTFEEENPGGCDGCPYYHPEKPESERFALSTPIQIGRIARFPPTGNAEAAPSSCAAIPNGRGTPPSSEPVGATVNGAPGSNIAQTPYLNGHASSVALDLKGIALPEGFAFEPVTHRFVVIRYTDDNYDPIVISEHPIYLSGIYESEAGAVGTCAYAFRQWFPHDGWKTTTVPAGEMLHAASGLVNLANGHANILEPALFKTYVQKAVDIMRHERSLQKRFDQMGWKKGPKGELEFLVGSTMIANSRVYEVVVSNELKNRAEYLGPARGGNVRRWREVVAELIPEYDHLGWYAILLSLGAPFMSWQDRNESGGVINFQEIGSGTGKTTKLRLAASVWGLWRGLLITNYDTGPSQGFMRAAICHLPFIHDELAEQIDASLPQLLIEYLKRLTEGKDKRRMEPGGKNLQPNAGEWSSYELSASNDSLGDRLEVGEKMGDAARQRLQELRNKVNSELTTAQAETLIEELWANSGWPGFLYMQYVVGHIDEANAALTFWRTWVHEHTNFRQKHRFNAREIIAAATAGAMAEKIGLLPIDYRKVIERVLTDLGALTGAPRPDEEIRGADGAEAMSQFLTYNLRNMMRVNGPWVAGLAPVEPAQRPFDKLLIRYELMNQRVFFPQKVFREFCVKEGFSYTDCVEKLTNCGFVLAVDRQVNLGAGTVIPAVRTRCIELDYTHPMAQMMPTLVYETVRPNQA